MKRAFNQLVNERINNRLKSAMAGTATPENEPSTDNSAAVNSSGTREERIETSPEELEGFYIIKSLLRDMVDPQRIIHRDTISYMGILLDDNNRKPLARLYFNSSNKRLGIFDEQRREEKVPIENLNDIYKYGDQLRRVFAFYEDEKESEK